MGLAPAQRPSIWGPGLPSTCSLPRWPEPYCGLSLTLSASQGTDSSPPWGQGVGEQGHRDDLAIR